MKKNTIYLLTGDIGGTNSRMSLYDTASSCCADQPLVVKYYRNAEHLPEDCHNHPEAFPTKIVIPFLKYCWEEQEKSKLQPLQEVTIVAALATAGMVNDNKVRMTNLGNLLIDGNAIQNNTKDKYLKAVVVCRIINDFVAVSTDVVHAGKGRCHRRSSTVLVWRYFSSVCLLLCLSLILSVLNA